MQAIVPIDIFNGDFAAEARETAINRLLENIFVEILLQTLFGVQIVLESLSIRVVLADGAQRVLLSLVERKALFQVCRGGFIHF